MFHVKHEADPLFASLPDARRARLSTFAELLVRWNRVINLVSRRDIDELWPRHILDSLQVLPLLPKGPVTDLGSGAGFPGLVLSIAAGRPVTLVESDSRKASFLREAARLTDAPALVVCERIESVRLAPAAAITARALAPLSQLLDWAAPLLAADGLCVFHKGRRAEDELTDAAAQWHMSVARTPSRSDPEGVILALGGLRRRETSSQ